MDPEIVDQEAAEPLYLADAHGALDARMGEGATPSEAWSEVVGERPIHVALAQAMAPDASGSGRATFVASDESLNHRGDRVITKGMDLGPFGAKSGGPVYWNHSTWQPPIGTGRSRKDGTRVLCDVEIDVAASEDRPEYPIERLVAGKLDRRVPLFMSVGLMINSAKRIDEGASGRRGWDLEKSYKIETTLTGTPCNSKAIRLSLARGGRQALEDLAKSIELTLPAAAPDLAPLADLLRVEPAELSAANAERLGELFELAVGRRLEADRARSELPALCAQAALAIAGGSEPDAGLDARCVELGLEAPWRGDAWGHFRAAAPLVPRAALVDLAKRMSLADLEAGLRALPAEEPEPIAQTSAESAGPEMARLAASLDNFAAERGSLREALERLSGRPIYTH